MGHALGQTTHISRIKYLKERSSLEMSFKVIDHHGVEKIQLIQALEVKKYKY